MWYISPVLSLRTCPVPPPTASAAYPLQVRQMDLKLEEVRLIQGNSKDTADIGGQVARLV